MEKWILALAILAVALSLVALGGSSRGKIAVVDMGRVLKESPKAQQFEGELAKKYQQLTEDLAKKKDLSKEEREKQQAAAYDEYLKTKDQLEQKLEREVAAAVAKIAKSRRLSVVLYKEAVRWGGVDLTPQLISALDQKAK